jgi:hypothetical protein
MKMNHNRNYRFLLILISLLTGFSTLGASIVASYTFDDTSGTSSAVTDLGTASLMTKSFGTNFGGNVSSGSYYDRSNNSIPDLPATDMTRYVAFTFTPNQVVDFSAFSMQLGITNSIGSAYDVEAAIFSSLTGFDNVGQSLGNSVYTSAAGSGTSFAAGADFNLTGVAALQGISTPVEFRIYYWDTAGISNSSAIFRLDNVNLSAVPEPSTVALFLGMAALGMCVWRRNSRI